MNGQASFWRDDALPFVESRRACDSRACYRPHSHPTVSIGAVDAGTSHFTGAETGPRALQPGTVVFIPAHCVHACNPLPDAAWSYQMLHLQADWVQSVLAGHDGTPASPLRHAHASTDPALYARFCAVNALLFSAAEPQEKEIALIELVGDCLHAHSEPIAAVAPSPAQRARLAGLLESLEIEGGDDSVQALAARAGLSRYQLIRLFRAATGMTPHAWQQNLRINRARDQLRAGLPLAEIAHALGFADQAHFQRTFKAHTGTTPGHYRR